MEKRAQPRFTAQFRSTFSGGQTEGRGRTLDLSAGGCRIESDMPLVEGAAVECRIFAPSFDWPLRIDEARVRWVRGNTFGVEFVALNEEERVKLQQLIKALEAELQTAARN
jgi:hypothetical protein